MTREEQLERFAGVAAERKEQMRYARGVRTARIAAGMTQRELGEAVGISAASVNRFEHEVSSVSDETLGRICEALGTDRAGLLAQGGPAFVPALAGFGSARAPLRRRRLRPEGLRGGMPRAGRGGRR